MVFMKHMHSIEAVHVKANEICRALHIPFKNKDNSQGHISSSIGITLFPSQAKTYGDLYQNADEALYKAKEKGKNTYVLYG